MATTEQSSPPQPDEALGAFNQPAAPVVSPMRAFLDPRLWLTSSGGRTIPLLVALVIMWIVFDVKTGGIYFSSSNIANILVSTALYGIGAIGIVIILLLGEIDLSMGSLIGLTGVCSALIMAEWVPTAPPVWQMIVGVAASLVIGMLCGAFQGFWVAVMKVPSFVVTLAGLLAFQGIALVASNSNTIVVSNDYFNALGSSGISAFDGGYLPVIVGKGSDPLHLSVGMLVALVGGLGYIVSMLINSRTRRKAGLSSRSVPLLIGQGLFITVVGVVLADWLDKFEGVPISVFILIVLLVVFAYVMRRTRFGRHIYATGGNAEAARRAGVSIVTLRWSAFVLSGLMAGVVGILFLARDTAANGGSVDPSILLLIIASAVIGGTSLFGGRGSVWSALTGALLLASVQYGMNLTLTSTNGQYFQYIVEGAILVGAVWLDTYGKSKTTVDRGA